MSIATEIARIQQNIGKIRAKLISFGLANDIDKLDSLANSISNIKNVGTVQAEVKEGESYQIPAGYHDGSGSVLGVSGGGNYNLQPKTITPTKEQQSVQSDPGWYGLSSVTVEAIPTIYQDVSSTTATAADVLSQRLFIAKDGTPTIGTMPDLGPVSGEIDGMSDKLSVDILSGYTSGGSITLSDSIESALREI